MNRKKLSEITADDVIAAYRKTKLRPKPFNFIPIDGCCCGLGAITEASGHILPRNGNFTLQSAIRAAGISFEHGIDVVAWTMGFDAGLLGQEAPKIDRHEMAHKAYEIGTAVREFFKEETK